MEIMIDSGTAVRSPAITYGRERGSTRAVIRVRQFAEIERINSSCSEVPLKPLEAKVNMMGATPTATIATTALDVTPKKTVIIGYRATVGRAFIVEE
tara:strand:+ start:2698 stop:2988 length:291 start_codon:yes stop_codon:yes gene_type:complete